MQCLTHGVELQRGIPCPQCIANPAPVGHEATSSELDEQLLALADECIGHKRKLWNRASDLIDDGTPLDLNTAAKLSAEAAKWLRLAREIRGEVSQRRQLREAMEHEKAMTGKRGGN